MKVFKFGGASINSPGRIQNTANILSLYKTEKILIIISAMGKTTNELENVALAFFAGEKEKSLGLFEAIKQKHLQLAEALNVLSDASDTLKNIFTEVEWLLHDNPVRGFDYYYDQIVCTGELMSTAIISFYLKTYELDNAWIDVRDIFRTDNNFRDASIDWQYTEKQVAENIMPIFNEKNFVITQGFIGSTDENESVTLGREGSDFSAAIFANLLNAESQTIWKDVEGVMNADPKQFPDAVFLSQLSYDEVIEMAYYGAQVIHPKTIKPLQNKNIPLHVRCFLNPELPGTIICEKSNIELPPIIILKENQVLLKIRSTDFSFIGESGIRKLYTLFSDIKISPNITQSGAISFTCSFDDKSEKIEKLATAASETFEVSVEKGITLLTIRHYNQEIVTKMTEGKNILLSQKTKSTLQVLMKQ